MLLTAIDEHHKGAYDFVYLPIDFRVSAFLFQCLIYFGIPYIFVNYSHGINIDCRTSAMWDMHSST